MLNKLLFSVLLIIPIGYSATDNFGIVRSGLESANLFHHMYYPSYLPPPLPPTPMNYRLQATMRNGENTFGYIRFEQMGHFGTISVSTNLTDLPAGRHALHIHSNGLLYNECRATGSSYASSLLGNIQVRNDGNLNIMFQSNANMFGPRGIVGRSIVIHQRPFESQNGPDILGQPTEDPYSIRGRDSRTDESQLGDILACGVIVFRGN